MESNDKPDVKLSERVRSGEFQKEITMSIWQSGIKYTFDRVPTPGIGTIADEIAALEQRLAEAEANTQRAIDAALESLEKHIEEVAFEFDESSTTAQELRGIRDDVRSRMNYNPLAEMQAQIKANDPVAWKHGEILYNNGAHDMNFIANEAIPLYELPGEGGG